MAKHVQEKLLEIKNDITGLILESPHLIEKADFTEISRFIESAVEKLEEVIEYQGNPETDYNHLLQKQQEFLESVRRSQKNWILTEIFSLMLSGQFNDDDDLDNNESDTDLFEEIALA
jgi:predicted translin family RNA/ssDNA-binding protein